MGQVLIIPGILETVILVLGTVPVNTFNTIGTFTVTLTVTDTNPTGCSETATIVVQVLGPYLLIDQSTYT